MRTMTFLLLLAGIGAAPAAAQQDQFNWHGRIPAGQAIEIKGVNGTIEAVAATGDEAQVTASKHGRRSNPADVKIQVVPHEGGVTICAVYPSRGDRPNECLPGARGHSETRDNDVQVDFVVHVPAGVKLVGRTVNGRVSAEGLRADADLQTVNGSVSATSTGLVRAKTVNGGIDVRMGRADWAGELELEST